MIHYNVTTFVQITSKQKKLSALFQTGCALYHVRAVPFSEQKAHIHTNIFKVQCLCILVI